MNQKRLKKYEYLSEKIRTQFFIVLIAFLLPFIVLYFHLNGYLGTFGKNATKKFKDSLSFISQVPF